MSDPHNDNPQHNLQNTLLMDIGNSRIKYVLSNKVHNTLAQTAETVTEILEQYNNLQRIIFASVRNSDLNQQITDICVSQNIAIEQVTTSAEAFGIKCAYDQYTNLGIDRWLTVLASRAHTKLPVAVIDAGTAITCDVVVDNQHQGGWIAPGYTLMQQAVTSKADRVFGNQHRQIDSGFGRGTEDCVNMGCLALLQGMVHSCVSELKHHGDDYRIYICGGDMDMLHIFENDKIQLKPNLVLEGLNRFI